MVDASTARKRSVRVPAPKINLSYKCQTLNIARLCKSEKYGKMTVVKREKMGFVSSQMESTEKTDLNKLANIVILWRNHFTNQVCNKVT